MNARLIGVVAGLAAVAVVSCGASGQIGKDKDKKKAPASTAPAAPAQPGGTAKAEPLGPKVLALSNARDWTFDAELLLQAGYEREAVDGAIREVPETFEFATAAIVFPVVVETASSLVELDGKRGDAKRKEKVTGVLFWNERPYDAEPVFADGYAAGTRLARWEMRKVVGRQAKLQVRVMLTCWETKYDEALAETIPWPASFPPVAASTFKPQLFVNGVDQKEDAAVKALVDKWCENKDPKSIKPAVLAKFLAGKVQAHVQVNGEGLLYNQTGTFRGFELIGPAEVARTGRGSEHDVACFLAAVYKAAGLPARTVIGFDRYEDKGSNKGFNSAKGGQHLRSWVEFCLVDPVTSKEIWVPVDIARLRKASSRPRPLEQPWKYFGSSDELAYMIPIAFQYHPPTTVQAEAPAFWGWLTTPQSALAVQSVRFQAVASASRGGEERRTRDKTKEDVRGEK